jgi:hypothetical protein
MVLRSLRCLPWPDFGVQARPEAAYSGKIDKLPRRAGSPGGIPFPIEVRIRGVETTLVVYEVYWANLMAGGQAAGSFQIQHLIALPWMRRQNTELGLYGDNPPRVAQEESLLFLYFVTTCAYYGYYGARQVVNLSEPGRRWRIGGEQLRLAIQCRQAHSCFY